MPPKKPSTGTSGLGLPRAMEYTGNCAPIHGDAAGRGHFQVAAALVDEALQHDQFGQILFDHQASERESRQPV